MSPAPVPRPQAPPAAKLAPSVIGLWLGTLEAGPQSRLRVQLRLVSLSAPGGCSVDSLDQKAFGIPCINVVAVAGALAFDVPQVGGNWKGSITPDGTTLDGTWSQGGPRLPLVLVRQTAPIEPPKSVEDPAIPPVDVAKVSALIDTEIAAALASGDLAPGTGAGVTIGVLEHGVRRIWSYGTTKPDGVFEIGSITKTFTGLILAQMAEQKKARMDEPVRELLPAGTVAAPASGGEITLLDLSTQHSGLPRMPDNFHPADDNNPYADYDDKALFAWLGKHGVMLPTNSGYEYSNLGVGLLGVALARRAGLTYEALLQKEVLGPLGMRETTIKLSPTLQARLVPGHDNAHKPAHAWDLDALAGAGGIRSTAADMLVYLEAQLHPDHLPAAAKATPEGKTLPAAIAASHVLRVEAGEGTHIALNWFHRDLTGNYWHNGATGGYSALVAFNVDKDFAVVVLGNTSAGDDTFTDKLGQHIVQRLTGLPAVSLSPAK
jgi:D-alanyl-D-alanine-carboxypeptidase/D-alanyl-D-alanine-endopeptidase